MSDKIDSKDKTRKKIYNARVEYWAIQPEVEKKLAAGHRVRPIYEELFQAGRLTMSYSSFCAYVRGRGERKEANKSQHTQQLTATLKPTPSWSQNKMETSANFTHSRTADLSELGPPPKPT